MRHLLLSILVTFFYACASTDYTNRTQLMLLDQKEEIALGERSAQEILKQSKISSNKTFTAMTQRVGSKIANAANRPDFKWEFYVIEGDQINAFCLPGGKVFVYTGLFELVSNDDELAVVLSHEIAHTILRHGAERMSMQNIRQIGGSLLGLLVQSTAPEYTSLFNEAYNVGSNVGVMLPFSRSHELEADKVGIALMQKTGYNTKAAIAFWEKMAANSKGNLDILSTHPSDAKRIKAIQEILKQ